MTSLGAAKEVVIRSSWVPSQARGAVRGLVWVPLLHLGDLLSSLPP